MLLLLLLYAFENELMEVLTAYLFILQWLLM